MNTGFQNRKNMPVYLYHAFLLKVSPAAQIVKNLPTIWETWVLSLGWKDSLEEGMVTHSSILNIYIEMIITYMNLNSRVELVIN